MVQNIYTKEDIIAMSYTNNIITFWKPYTNDTGKLCQWYKSDFIEDGVKFNCCEHYMMYKKAMLFGDSEIASEILKETDPSKMKAYGRRIKNFDNAIWDEHKFDIVYTGNLLKFTQNHKLKAYLLSTNGSILAEASPYDTVWGIGLSDDSLNVNYPDLWPGQNLLGCALMQVRDTIYKDKLKDNL